MKRILIDKATGDFKVKKRLLFLCIFLDIAAVGLIPVNALLFDMPEYVTIIVSLIAIVSAVLFIERNQNRKVAKTIIGILTVIAVVLSVLGSYCNPYWNSITFRSNVNIITKPYTQLLSSDEAIKDLDYTMKTIRKLHPVFLNGTPEYITRQYEEVKARIEESDYISVNDLAGEIESILSILRDGHTYVRGVYDEKIMKYYRKWANDGYEITAVNGIQFDEFFEQKSSLYSYETPSWGHRLLLDDILTEAGIDYLGLDLANGIEYTLISEDGKVRTETCYPDDFIPWTEYYDLYKSYYEDTTEKSFVSYEIDGENSIAILRLDECNYNSEYIDCLRSMFAEIRDKRIENVAVDLRYNGGGSSLVADEFFRYLDIDSYKVSSIGWRLGFLYLNLGSGTSANKKYDDLLFRGDLYLLTSTRTFSSAMMFAQYVKDNGLGTIIGEAPGNNPNGYGEVAGFILPNSQLFMQVSTKRFYRADKECTDELVYPDIECSSHAAMEELYRVIKEN